MMSERTIILCFMPSKEWVARHEDWDLGEPTGWGKTQEEAIADLEAQLEDDQQRYMTETGSAS